MMYIFKNNVSLFHLLIKLKFISVSLIIIILSENVSNQYFKIEFKHSQKTMIRFKLIKMIISLIMIKMEIISIAFIANQIIHIFQRIVKMIHFCLKVDLNLVIYILHIKLVNTTITYTSDLTLRLINRNHQIRELGSIFGYKI